MTIGRGVNKFKAGGLEFQYRTEIDRGSQHRGGFRSFNEVFMYGELIPIGGGDDIVAAEDRSEDRPSRKLRHCLAVSQRHRPIIAS